MAATFKVNTSGTGSNFQAIVYRTPEGGGRFDGRVVDKREGFTIRSEARTWGNRRARELAAQEPS